MKWIDDKDNIPLAQLKKSRHADNVSFDFLSLLEMTTYSLTQLQHAAPPIGPVHDFMEQPLQDFQGCLSGFLPQPVVFASDPSAVIAQAATMVSTGVGSLSAASVAALSRTPRHSAASPRDSSISPAPVSSFSMTLRRFSRSPKGRRRGLPLVEVSQPASVQVSDVQEECLVRPPPHV